MKKHKAVHDPFHDDAPQISSVYQYENPPDLKSIDETAGGVNAKPALITDPNHRARFVPTEEPEHSFYKRGGK